MRSRARGGRGARRRARGGGGPSLSSPLLPSLALSQHLLIPLNACRHDTFYMPWRCGPERHAYEKCQYVEHLRTVKAKLEG
jgi:hypothetical protein